MANRIQIRRGLKSQLPTLALGEFGLCTDTKEIFIGTPTGNVGFPNADHTHDFTHNHDDVYYLKTQVDGLLLGYSKTNHTHSNYSLTSHNHASLYAPISHSHDDKYYTESEIDTKLSSKADGTTVSGHTGNSTIHVTSGDKATWNGKANVSQIPTKLSQLEADVELGGNFATIGTVKPADGSMWYEVI